MSEPTKPNGGTPMTRMNRHVDAYLDPDAHESHSFDRRTLVVSAAGALVAAALGGSARAAHFASSAGPVARAQFDPALARRLQQVLDDVVASSGGKVPGAILHAERTGRGSWTGAAGLGRLDPNVAMHPGDRFRAGSIVKPFVATTVLQLVEQRPLHARHRATRRAPRRCGRPLPDRTQDHASDAARSPKRSRRLEHPGHGRRRRP